MIPATLPSSLACSPADQAVPSSHPMTDTELFDQLMGVPSSCPETDNAPPAPIPAGNGSDVTNDPALAACTDRTLSPPSSFDATLLTVEQPRYALPGFWRKAFAQKHPVLRNCGSKLQRMYVAGDGSCATGALFLSLLEPEGADDSLPDSQLPPHRLVHSLGQLTTLRSQLIASTVNTWTSQEWCQNVPQNLRDEFWMLECHNGLPHCHCHGKCTCTISERTGARELAMFRKSLATPTYNMGELFFHVAAGVLHLNVLMLCDDHRYGHRGRAQHRVVDFGRGFPDSIIVFALVTNHGSGHFESVGLALEDGGFQAFFACNDPVVLALRAFAMDKADVRTIDHERVDYSFTEPFPTDTHIDLSGSPKPAPGSLEQPSLSSRLAAVRGPLYRRPLRLRRPTQRYEEFVQSNLPMAVRDRAPDVPVLPCPPRAVHAPSASPAAARTDLVNPGPVTRPADRGSHSSDPPVATDSSHGPLVAAAPRSRPSNRFELAAMQLLDDVRAWIHKMANRGQLARRCHISMVPTWIVRCREALQALYAALCAVPMDELLLTKRIIALWILPQEVFTIPGKIRGGAKNRKAQLHRIARNLNDPNLYDRVLGMADELCHSMEELLLAPHAPDYDWDYASGMEVGAVPRPSDPASVAEASILATSDLEFTSSNEPDPDIAAAYRASSLFKKGYETRAIHTLKSTTKKADLNSDVERAAVAALHPPCMSVRVLRPADSPDGVVAVEWMINEMRASDSGAAPGVSGYASNFIRVLATDIHCVQALAYFTQQMYNNTLPPAVRTLLTCCLVVSLEKPNGGRRPIAIGDMFYKFAARYALTLVVDDARRIVHPHQYGMGQPDGCTQVVQSLQHLLEAPPRLPSPQPGPSHDSGSPALRPAPDPASTVARPLACLSIDMQNAFNSIDRRAVLQAVYSHPELARCWRIVDFAYGRPSPLLMKCDVDIPVAEAFLESQSGVRQGDPLSAMLFGLAIHPVYDSIAKQLQAGVFAFMDDGHGVGYLQQCWAVWQQLPELLAPLKLSVNPAKCELTCFHLDGLQHEGDRAALQSFEAAGVKINRKCLRVLGCLVGATPADIAHELATDPFFRAESRAAFRRIPHMHEHHRCFALRRLTSIVINNRLRAMPPAATDAHAAEYDAQLLEAAHAMVGITPDDGTTFDRQLQQSAGRGGFGLTSAVTVAPAAYLAGAECTLRKSPVFAAVWAGTEPLDPSSTLYAGIVDSLARVQRMEAALISQSPPAIVARVTASILPSSADHFVAHFRANHAQSMIQHSVSHRISTLTTIAAKAEAGRDRTWAGRRKLARLQALDVQGASLWLTTLPTEPQLTLTRTQWWTAARLRLGLPGNPSYEIDGVSCRHKVAAAEDSWHPLCCEEKCGADITFRHNRVLHDLRDFARLANIPVRIEPAELDPRRELRPDIQVDLHDRTLLGDVTVVHPTAKKWSSLAASARGVAAVGDAAGAQKSDWYDDLARGLDCLFSPFVVYTYGGFHASAWNFIDRLCASLDPVTCLVSADDWRMALRRQIAISVQRGNADIMIHAAQRVRGAVLHSRRIRVRDSPTRASHRVRRPARSAFPWPVRSLKAGLRLPHRAASLPLPSGRSGTTAPSSGAGPSLVHTVTIPLSVSPSPASAVPHFPSVGDGAGADAAASVSPAMAGSASDARSALAVVLGALDPVLAARSVASGPA